MQFFYLYETRFKKSHSALEKKVNSLNKDALAALRSVPVYVTKVDMFFDRNYFYVLLLLREGAKTGENHFSKVVKSP